MAGRVIVPDIGISTESICEDEEIIRTAGTDIYRQMLQKRPEDSNKGTYGRLLIIAGSKKNGRCCLSECVCCLYDGVRW